jgi:hypothetical protein
MAGPFALCGEGGATVGFLQAVLIESSDPLAAKPYSGE